jgi:hypothetical protein
VAVSPMRMKVHVSSSNAEHPLTAIVGRKFNIETWSPSGSRLFRSATLSSEMSK